MRIEDAMLRVPDFERYPLLVEMDNEEAVVYQTKSYQGKTVKQKVARFDCEDVETFEETTSDGHHITVLSTKDGVDDDAFEDVLSPIEMSHLFAGSPEKGKD